jgi:hypothetical protein
MGGGAKMENNILNLHRWYNVFVLIFLLVSGVMKKDNMFFIITLPIVGILVFLFTRTLGT